MTHSNPFKPFKKKQSVAALTGLSLLLTTAISSIAQPVLQPSGKPAIGKSAILLTPAQAQQLAALTPEQINGAIDKCIDEILDRQVKDGENAGAFRMTVHGTWLENYFALQACLALLSRTNDSNSDEAKAVKKYLLWYASVIDPNEGVAHNYDPDKQNDPGYDSLDGVAGLHLLVSARYFRIAGSLPAEAIAAYKTSLQTLNDVILNKKKVVANYKSTAAAIQFDLNDKALKNGLSIDTGRHCQHYLADNVEAFAGLSESSSVFASLGDGAASKQVADLANGIAKASSRFAQSTRFAFVINELDVPLDNDPGRGYRAYANLYGLAYLPSKYPNLWTSLKQTYGTEAALDEDDATNASAAPSELWLIAANKVAPAEAQTYWRPRVVKNVEQFDENTYIGRLAVTVLALTGGTATYPEVKPVTSPTGIVATGQIISSVPDASFTSSVSIPLVNSQVRLEQTGQSPQVTTSDAQGRFSFSNLNPGSYTVKVVTVDQDGSGSGAATPLPFTLSQSLKIAKPKKAATSTQITVPAFKLYSVWGQVNSKSANKKDPTRTAIAGATVQLSKTTSAGYPAFTSNTVTDANGFYLFSFLGKARFKLLTQKAQSEIVFPKSGVSVSLPYSNRPTTPSRRIDITGTMPAPPKAKTTSNASIKAS